MRGLRWIGWAVAAFTSIVLVAPAANAAAKTIYLNNAVGSDGPGCGGVAVGACKTLQFAADQAASGDTLLMVNPGDYGPVTITKSLTIQGIAGAGVFSPPNVACIIITAGAGNEVIIREFTCDQRSLNKDGIDAAFGASLSLDHVVIHGNHAGRDGVFFGPTSGKANLFIRDSAIDDFASAGVGVPGGTNALLQNVTLEGNALGVATGTDAQVSVADCTISLSAVGLSSGGRATMNVSNSLITLNKKGLDHGTIDRIISLGGNSLAGNTVDGTFTAKTPPK